ncbi:MAG: MBL fold metallo-hydrolase [Desulfatibacillaceae bacterium]
MRVFREAGFGKVNGFELGRGFTGRPIMTVYMYIVDGLMIDTGLAHMRNTVRRIVTEWPVHQVFVTHYHEDHGGNAGAIRDLLPEIPMYAHPLCVEKMASPFSIRPYQHLIWGRSSPVELAPMPERIRTERMCFEPIHTPGHSSDHVALYERNRGWLFSGDLYLGDRIKYFRRDEHLGTQIDSLKRALELDFDSLFCAHHPKPEKGRDRLVEKLQYLEDLYGSVTEQWEKGHGVADIMRRLQLREDRFVLSLTLGNVSARNMVRSVVEDLERDARQSA